MDKRAYSGGQLLGDLLAAAGAGARGYAAGHQANAEARRREGEGAAARYEYLSKMQKQHRARADNLHSELEYRADPENWLERYLGEFKDDQASLTDLSRQAYAARRAEYDLNPLLADAGQASGKAHAAGARHERDAAKVPYPTALAALSGLGPVNDHIIASPLATMLGQLAAQGLLQKFVPTASPGAFAGASAAGALAGRMGLRGVDALVDAGKPERAFEAARRPDI
jgi:hypothetical protein